MKSKSLHIIKRKTGKQNINSILENIDKTKNNSFRIRVDDEEIIETSDEKRMLFGAGYSEFDYEEYQNENNEYNEDAEEDIDESMERMDVSQQDVDISSDAESNVDRQTGMAAGDGSNVIGNTVLRSNNYASYDPRIAFFDGFVSKENAVIPFATNTAASAYYDLVFTVENAIYKAGGGADKSTSNADGVASSNTKGEDINNGNVATPGQPKDSDMVAPNKSQVSQLQQDGDVFGTASLVNSYTLTRLIGGLRGSGPQNFSNHMYDIRDTKRFYDKDIVEDGDDFSSINNPTTTNIIEWSNKDLWGRTPYKFTDFVFCKFWNIIPNNRLLTLRKYAVPVYDNLNFPNMFLPDG